MNPNWLDDADQCAWELEQARRARLNWRQPTIVEVKPLKDFTGFVIAQTNWKGQVPEIVLGWLKGTVCGVVPKFEAVFVLPTVDELFAQPQARQFDE